LITSRIAKNRKDWNFLLVYHDIHLNPVEEGLVFRTEDYVYSSAIDYAGEKGMLDIFVIE
jgi:hypothetical protein